MSTSPSAHACTPTAQRTRRPASTATNPLAHKPEPLPFPPLPEPRADGMADEAAFWRAAFLRDLHMADIARQLLNKALDQAAQRHSGRADATALYLSNSLVQQQRELKDSFKAWMGTIGGLASSSMQQGGAA